jgi:nucleoside-diphosphate-sugar epimerase
VRVLVTGANGFVGRATVDYLASRGIPVLALGGSSAVVERERGEETPLVRRQSFDLAGDEPFEPLFEEVDSVIHLAGRAHVRTGSALDSEADYERVNVAGLERLARAAGRAGVSRFVNVSTIGVNGDETQGKAFSEQDEPRPHNAYARSKRAGELALARVAEETGLAYVVARPTLVIGAAAKANVRSLMRLIDKGLPLPLGAVQNQRSYAGLDNLVNFLDVIRTHKAAAGETFLFADQPSISTPDLIRRLAFFLDRKVTLAPIPPGLLRRAAGLVGVGGAFGGLWKSLEVSTAKATTTLDWAQPHDLDHSLRAAAVAYRAEQRH